MDQSEITHTTRPSSQPAEARLERCVADALRIIAAACDERNAPPVKAARRHLAEIYGATRLSRQRERRSASA
ncbi:hypothetical protein [Methylobacterium sp.]|jgi:hypothetical protein|uniref:hypothetical protein n=1 Tax=Methylobacterium sp. TaxID=409 RepID=UPI0025FBD0A5|nr:hypothetical protein [Methylobacterium sp.]MBY0259769.1 hypothetical protein [Methylobacterium sp.]